MLWSTRAETETNYMRWLLPLPRSLGRDLCRWFMMYSPPCVLLVLRILVKSLFYLLAEGPTYPEERGSRRYESREDPWAFGFEAPCQSFCEASRLRSSA